MKKSKLKQLSEIFDKERSDASLKKSEQLLDSYFEENGAVGGEHLKTLELRSGHYYPTAPRDRDSTLSYLEPLPPPPPLIMEESGNNVYRESAVSQTQVVQTPRRVTPAHISIRQFSGSDTDYTNRQFLDS